MTQHQSLGLSKIREKLSQARGKDYWRSLEELALGEEFQEFVAQQFPQQASQWKDGLSRRRFLSLIGASLALAGLAGCGSRPRELILPYVNQPDEVTPGNPLYFATAMPMAGYGQGLLVKSLTGRPIKIEGNPDHPANRKTVTATEHARFGPSDGFAQASLLGMYDPDRSQSVINRGHVGSWDSFTAEVNRRLSNTDGTGINRDLKIRILTETVTSPSVAWKIRSILQRFPTARWHIYEPVNQDNVHKGLQGVFNRELSVHYDFTKADVVLALDADFLAHGPGHVRYARDFASRRRAHQPQNSPAMNRLYVAESMPTITGAKADHRWPLRAGQIASLARAVAEEVDVNNLLPQGGEPHGLNGDWIRHLADDLKANRGRAIVLAGEGQPPEVHAMAHAMNQALGNDGETVIYTPHIEAHPEYDASDSAESLRHLVNDMGPDGAGIDMLFILGGNPVYNAPAGLQFAQALSRVPFRVHLSQYEDETSYLCHWHIPEAHYLEAWGDVRAFDGTVSIIQPLIEPLYGGKTATEVLSVLSEEQDGSSYDILRSYWGDVFTAAGPGYSSLESHLRSPPRANTVSADFESWWQRALHDGVIENSAAPIVEDVTPGPDWEQRFQALPTTREGLEIDFRPDPTIWDGRFANNGWLQETPKPISKLTWDNAAYLSPATAIRLGYATEGHAEEANGKVVTLNYQNSRVDAPLWVLPGHADDSVTVHIGYGRTRSGRVGNGAGFNAYSLWTSHATEFGTGLTLQGTGRTQSLACTQHHHLMHDRHLVFSGTADHPPDIPDAHKVSRHPLTLYTDDHQHPDTSQWGMAVDLTSCIGCGACITACQAENNIPVVGKEEVARGREMHWIRVDNYYSGEAANPSTYSQPVMCMQCENAPCEVVCPVEATVHSDDGLNDMVYNRCVGTRYCSNNCPYKVRRFNFLQYSDIETESLRLMYNPDVTIRSRGVMEKCTYCVQRIRGAESIATREDRHVRDGEIQTACQSVCPAGAIVFGDIRHNDSRVSQMRREPMNYGLLVELNTQPRTTYLASLKNPNPNISVPEEGHADE